MLDLDLENCNGNVLNDATYHSNRIHLELSKLVQKDEKGEVSASNGKHECLSWRAFELFTQEALESKEIYRKNSQVAEKERGEIV